MGEPRLISLVPSITELLIDLGLQAWLHGRTGFCIHPAEQVSNIAKVGGTKSVNLEKIRRLAPTHVFVNVDENELSMVEKLREFVPHIIVTHPQSAQDNLHLIDQVIQALAPAFSAHPSIFQPMVQRAEALKTAIAQGLQSLQNQTFKSQNVLYLIWREPWMTVARDTYISRMLSLIDWHTFPNQFGGESGATRYPKLLGNEPWLARVQRVLLSSEPYSFKQQHLHEVQTWLPQAQVQLVDGELLSWYGSRAVKGLQYLKQLSADVQGAGKH